MSDYLPIEPGMEGLLRGWAGCVEVLIGDVTWTPALVGLRNWTDGSPWFYTDRHGMCAGLPTRLDLSRPEVLHRLADWLAAQDHPCWWALPRNLGGSLPALWARHVLAWNVRSVAAGGKMIEGVFGPWSARADGSRTRTMVAGWHRDQQVSATNADEQRLVDANLLAYLLPFADGPETEPLRLPPTPHPDTKESP